MEEAHPKYLRARQKRRVPSETECPFAVSEGQGVGAQGHDDARFGFGERWAEAAGVAAHEVELEAGEFAVRDAPFAEFAEAGVDAINGERIFGDAAHHVAGGVHLGDGGRGNLKTYGVPRDPSDLA